MKKLQQYLPWVLLCIMGICIFLLNYYSIPGHDEMSYAYWGQSTPMEGEVNRVSSFMDIVRQQYGDYMKNGGNGRVLTHGIVAFFAGFKLYTLFDVVNTLVWFLFVWLVLKEGHIQAKSAKTYLLGSVVVWWFLWYGETCSLNAAFALNYLWIACVTVVMMRVWRGLTTWWLVPLFFLYGWTSEAFVLPMIATVVVSWVIKIIVEKRLTVNWKRFVAWLLMVVGAGFLCLGPAAQTRANGTLDGGILQLIMVAIKSNIGVILLGAPFVLMLLILTILWVQRKTFFKVINRSLDWWLFLGASYGLYCLVSANGVVRLAMPMLLATVILLLREREVFCVKKSGRIVFVFICFCWLIASTVLQTRIGLEVKNMLSVYQEDSQGITCRKATTTGPSYYSVATLVYNDWHTHLFRREYEHAKNPTVFTPWLYQNLYQTPNKFFEVAAQLGESGLYVASDCPKAVVAYGHKPLTDSQKAILDSYFKSLDCPSVGWKRFVPGRFKMMFPADDFFLNIVKENEFRFIAKDGLPYTLYVLPEKRK